MRPMKTKQALVAAVTVAAMTAAPAAWTLGDDQATDTDKGSKARQSAEETASDAKAAADKERKPEDARARAKLAADVLRDMMESEDHAIPEYLLERAEGIAVVPHMVKAAFAVGGRGGSGLISTRQDGGDWTSPLYVRVGGASYGAQIGVEATDLVLVFVEEGGLEALVKDRVKLGADISVAAGPLGRKAEVGTNVTLDAAIYSYSRSKGLFAGAAVDGAVLQIDDSENKKIYGEKVDAKKVLDAEIALDAPGAVRPFLDVLQEIAPSPGSDTAGDE